MIAKMIVIPSSHHLQTQVDTTHGKVTFACTSQLLFAQSLSQQLWTEFNRIYDANEFVSQVPIKEFVLVSDLKFNGGCWPAVPVYELETLYIDCSLMHHAPPTDRMNYYRNLIHHEIFHMLEFKVLDAECHDQCVLECCDDDGWERQGGAFVSHYAALNVREDRAETFSHMMTSNGHPETMIDTKEAKGRGDDSQTLQRKSAIISRFLSFHYANLVAA